ncbi:MAG: sigma-70 family RNA polymerase sigma factor [Vicinamibacterales bacterium]
MSARAPRPPAPADEADAALLAGLRRQEAWAFEAVVREHGARLLLVARRICRNDEEARDAVQTAYLSAFRSLDSFAGDARLSTWLHRIVVNAALMRVRSRRRKGEEPLDPDHAGTDQSGPERFASSLPAADALVARRERHDALHACILDLPEAYRAVLRLRDIEELSTPEAARRLNVTTTTVKVRLHRARRALGARLRQEFGHLAGATPA